MADLAGVDVADDAGGADVTDVVGRWRLLQSCNSSLSETPILCLCPLKVEVH